MIEWLESVDRALFLALNSFHHPALDVFMELVSHKFTWIPLYLIIAVFAQRKWGWKGLGIFAVGSALTIVLTDQISVKLFKNVFERYRPCHNEEIAHLVHIVNERCGGLYGFVSSHAANHFGIATFFALTLFRNQRPALIMILLWAALVSYSRIYLGVHYPADITVGALLGIVLGYGTVQGFWVVLRKLELVKSEK